MGSCLYSDTASAVRSRAPVRRAATYTCRPYRAAATSAPFLSITTSISLISSQLTLHHQMNHCLVARLSSQLSSQCSPTQRRTACVSTVSGFWALVGRQFSSCSRSDSLSMECAIPRWEACSVASVVSEKREWGRRCMWLGLCYGCCLCPCMH